MRSIEGLIMSNWRIPFSSLNYGKEEEDALLRVLRTGWISMGPEIQAFERELADLQRTNHAFAVANGTAALHLALLALDVGPDDEVIQPALNFVAGANMTRAVGAVPVFADIISIDEPTIDPAHVEKLITPRTKALMVMHYGGYLCRMQDLLSICQKHNLRLIEDACHAIGVVHDGGVMAGSFGDVGAFSFFSNKNIATGEGGAVVTGRDDVAERIRLLRSHGMTTLTWDRYKGHASSYEVITLGFNYRLDEIHASLGREQLRKLDAANRRRGELTRLYRSLMQSLPEWHVSFADYPGNRSAFHLMPAVAPDAAARNRAAQSLRENGIQSSLHYPCITSFSAFFAYRDAPVHNSHEYASRVITLPLHPKMADSDVEQVISGLARATNSSRGRTAWRSRAGN
jgi:dTDP-4-amino-4,6-dideoxygalactose transaminase